MKGNAGAGACAPGRVRRALIDPAVETAASGDSLLWGLNLL